MDRATRTHPHSTLSNVIDGVERGEVLLVTRDGRAVAELRPVRAPGVPRDLLIKRARTLPPVDPDQLRADLGAAIDLNIRPGLDLAGGDSPTG